MKFEEYYWYFQDNYLKQLLMATTMKGWVGWVSKPIE